MTIVGPADDGGGGVVGDVTDLLALGRRGVPRLACRRLHGDIC